jgi:hypothetical protein
MEEESRVMSLILRAQDVIATPDGRERIESHQYMVKNQEDAIRVFSDGRFDITADVVGQGLIIRRCQVNICKYHPLFQITRIQHF